VADDDDVGVELPHTASDRRRRLLLGCCCALGTGPKARRGCASGGTGNN
jgi:hypothetical protein